MGFVDQKEMMEYLQTSLSVCVCVWECVSFRYWYEIDFVYNVDVEHVKLCVKTNLSSDVSF